MNPPKVTDEDYIQFLIATPKVCSATEAARVQPEEANAPQHDAFTRLLHRLEPDALTLWKEAAVQVERQGGAYWWWTTRPWTNPMPRKWSLSTAIGRESTTRWWRALT